MTNTAKKELEHLDKIMRSLDKDVKRKANSRRYKWRRITAISNPVSKE